MNQNVLWKGKILQFFESYDVEYDFRLDSRCGDPDTDSLRLYQIHSHLWSKFLFDNRKLQFEIESRRYGRLVLSSNLMDNLSSDRMCPHFVGKYNGKFDDWITEIDKEIIQRKARTIGGHIVFPAHRRNGFTINQARGVNKKICDRFDLTLECIRRYYINEQSPLSKILDNYSKFFNYFFDFNSYVEFFMLQDFVENNGRVIFVLPFDNFHRSALPTSKDEYKNYIRKTIELIDKRNIRILKEIQSIVQ